MQKVSKHKETPLNTFTQKVWTREAPEAEEDSDSPSKTQRKADMDALQDMGVTLAQLPKDKLAKLNLPEILLDAIKEYKRLTANGALRRQRQYLGSLMRNVETASIAEHLKSWEGKNSAENARFHQLENWRNRLIQDADALSVFMQKYPSTDSQELRTLIRNAQREEAANKPPKSSRELFKKLREITELSTSPDETSNGLDTEADL